jgi:hypothetical protein
MESSVRFLASLFALEFEPRTYLPSLETRGHDVPIARLDGSIEFPQAEATPEVKIVEACVDYQLGRDCPPPPSAQIVIPAADPLDGLGQFDESPFTTLFSVATFDEGPVTLESVFPTLSRIDLEASSQ